MTENKVVLGKVDLIKTHIEGQNKEGKPFAFDSYSIQLGDTEIRVVPRAEDKSLFEYKLSHLAK